MTLLEVGSLAPDIAVNDTNGNSVRLTALKGKNIVLYFYPKDDTPGCTIEACEFRDNIGAFANADTVVLGVSTDDEASHQAFAKKFTLNFPLLADSKKELSTAFGVLGTHGFANRVTFVIDKTGVVRKVFSGVNPKGHTSEVKEALKALP